MTTTANRPFRATPVPMLVVPTHSSAVKCAVEGLYPGAE
jgi:hypothetical protein